MFYLTLFAFSTILFFIAQKAYTRSVLLFYILSFVAIFSLSFIAGARDNTIGTDILIYGKRVYDVSSSDVEFSKSYDRVSNISELFYFAINWICSAINSKYGLSLFVQMFIQTTLVFLGMKRYMDRAPLWLTMLVYELYYYNLSLNLMRQGIAMAFVFWAYRYIELKQFKSFLICAILSYFFHKTGMVASIILMAIYWALTKDEKCQRILIFVAIALSICGIYMFSVAIQYLSMAIPAFEHFLSYAEGSRFKAGISTMDVLLRLAFVAVAIFFYRYKEYRLSYCYVLFFLLTVDIASLVLGKYAYFTTRFAYYFLIIEIPYVLILLSSEKITLGTKYIVRVVYVAFFLYYCVRFNYVEGNNSTYPYRSEFLMIDK